jgi:uncharacterized protein YqgQ
VEDEGRNNRMDQEIEADKKQGIMERQDWGNKGILRQERSKERHKEIKKEWKNMRNETVRK